jgi:uncharacterized protein DUF6624
MKRLGIIVTLCCGVSLSTTLQAQTTPKTAAANPTLRQELLNRVQQDQAIRNELISKGIQNPDKALLARMQTIDSENTARMKTIIKQHGWPGPDLVCKDGTEAAFLLVQHADYEFQKQVLPLVRQAYQSHKLSGQNYALLLDRVLVRDGKPQVYGTQAKSFDHWKGHEPVLEPIEDEGNVDKRRAEVGLPPLAEYFKMLKEMYFPNDK